MDIKENIEEFKTLCDTIDDLNTSCKLTEEQLSGMNTWACKAEKLLSKMKVGIDKVMDFDKQKK